MTYTLAKIWARRINAGAHTISEVYSKYGEEGVELVHKAYFELYGQEVPDEIS